MKNKISIPTEVKTLSITITAAQILEVIVPITTSLEQDQEDSLIIDLQLIFRCSFVSGTVLSVAAAITTLGLAEFF
ncbi:hypothetical protein cypCar_00000489 [Cyprinus carpio]|nr:hypothetical protein cypCar_00000489 [Cyprinus carpio]